MVYLYIWAVIAASNFSQYKSWAVAGEYDSPQACVSAAANLGLTVEYRCISRVSGEQVR